jgi:hypothetical protein
MRRWLGLLIVMTSLALALAVAAGAAPRSGRWTGYVSGYQYASLTFQVRVGGKRIQSFLFKGTYGSLHCGGGAGGAGGPTISNATIAVPSIPVHHGAFKITYRHNGGGLLETDTIRGTIKSHTASGTVDQSFTGGGENCGTPGSIHWIAQAGRRAPKAPTLKGVAGAQYAGQTTQGFALSIKVASNSKSISRLYLAQLNLTCIDGSTVDTRDLPIDNVALGSDGSFAASHTYSSGAQFNIHGIVSRSSASGQLGETITYNGTPCQSGNVPFNISRQ